jgi:hypothetical protein
VLQADELAGGVEPRLHALVGEWPGEIHREVVFARVDNLDWLADRLGSEHGRDDHVRFEAAAEASAQELLVHHDVLGIDAGGGSRDRPRAGGELVAGVDVPYTVLLLGERIHRLQRSMNVDARCVDGAELLVGSRNGAG